MLIIRRIHLRASVTDSDVRQSLERVVASDVFTSSNAGEPETAEEVTVVTTEATAEPVTEPISYTDTPAPVPAISEQSSAPPLESQQWAVADGSGYQLGVPQEGILTAESASYGAVQQQLVDQAAQQQLEQQQLQQEQLLQYQQQQLYTGQEPQQAQAEGQKAAVEVSQQFALV